ncbi:gas vesicle protein GvpO [Marinococcus halophilus]|uniref:gas vesicle protein GvpO n=1 Tax=Marinococcus halophilus TaxID=1371 RepID=UPI0009A8008E|nr:gas vesicle protein GvpO [Marinococcus halophilus]
MAAKQSTTKTEEKTEENQSQELKNSKSGSYKPFSSDEEEQPKEQIKGPAKSGSSSASSQKSSGENEKADDKGGNDEVNTTTAASKKNTAKSRQTKKGANEETAPQEEQGEESFAPITSDMFETIRSFFEETMNSPVRITAIMDAEDGWDIEVELVEEKEYTQKYGRDQLIGIYKATMNKDQKITSYQRMNTRPRSTPFEKKER